MGAGRKERWPGWLAWGLWALAVLGLASVPWFDRLTRQAGRPELTQLNASTIPYLLAIVVAATVGAVLAGRLPRHPVGWLLLGVGLSVAGSGVADGYARYGLVARPGALPAARWVAIYSPATTVVGLALVGYVLRCRHPAGAGGPGWPRPGRSPSWPP
jgi:UDP-N-acetylmuramyl pentapeptide phosphotransferase/UDP-N-acetylglucosamine-1-phosphate transferase